MSIKQKSKQSYKYPMGKLKQSQTSPQQKSLKKERYEHAYSQPTKIIQESTKTREENLPVEANEKSTITIPENNPLQLGWPEISKPCFFFS